jgi:hypothetical protein
MLGQLSLVKLDDQVGAFVIVQLEQKKQFQQKDPLLVIEH